MLCWLFRLVAGSVALRKESVDRNCRNRFCPTCQWRSLSARRAWIEIRRALGFVDPDKSLSARRAWIEIRRALGFVDPDKGRSPQGERG